MLWSAPGKILTCTQLDFSVRISHLSFFVYPPKPFLCFHCPACSPQVHWHVWLLHSFPRRKKLFFPTKWSWMILFKFERRIALLKVTGQRRQSQFTPSCREGSRGSTAGALWHRHCCRAAAAGAVLPQQDGAGLQVGLTLSGWVRGQRTGMKGKTSSRAVFHCRTLFFFPSQTVWFHVTWTHSTEWWHHNGLC